MNYLNNLRSILNTFANGVRDLAALMQQARKVYVPDMAEKEIATAQAKIYDLAKTAQQKIEAEKETAIKEVEKWGVLHGSDIDQGDLALLNGSFDLTGKDLADLVERHRNNSAMLRAIETYYKKRQAGMTREEIITDTMVLPEIPTMENKITAIQHFAEAAKELVKQVQADPEGLTKFKDKVSFTDASAMDMLINGFGEPGISKRKDLYVLGE